MRGPSEGEGHAPVGKLGRCPSSRHPGHCDSQGGTPMKGRDVRGTAWLVAAVAGLALSPVGATGPLDPPTSRLTVRLIEPTTRTPPPLRMVMGVTPTDDTGAIVAVEFARG